jgi:tRNA modification GTPase
VTSLQDTIFALATPPGRSALQIVRISGEESAPLLQKMTGGLPKPRATHYTSIYLDEDSPVDQALALFFKGPASATGEDMAELHLHGSPVLSRMVLEWLDGQRHCRLADHGEFSRRAFLNGKLNLDQAEAIADLIDADTVAQHRQAIRQIDGVLSNATENWRRQLIELSGELEALIDFADEEIPQNIADRVVAGIDQLSQAMSASLESAQSGLINRDGFKIAILGRPNAGKSTFLNRWTGDDRAIVSDQPGTTRDLVQVSLDVEGVAVHLTDTAGIRHDRKADAVEEEGIRRALKAAADARLVLILIDHRDKDVTATYDDLCRALHDTASKGGMPDILPVLTKADLLEKDAVLPEWLLISAKTGIGIADLDEMIKDKIVALTDSAEPPLLTRHRHISVIQQAAEALYRAGEINLNDSPELMAEEFRFAATALGRISGRVDVEDLLDHIFASFCIGK